MTAPTIRHRQQITAAVLANLLTRDLPVAYWTIAHTDGRAEGLVRSVEEVRAWAQVISCGVTSILRSRRGRGELRACGDGPYACVTAWYPLTAAELAELDKAAGLATVAGAR